LNLAMIVITNCRSSSPNRDDLTNRMRRRHREYGGRRSMQLTWACGTQRRVATMRWAPCGRALRAAGGRRWASYHGRSGTARRVNIQLISGLRAVNPLGTCPGENSRLPLRQPGFYPQLYPGPLILMYFKPFYFWQPVILIVIRAKTYLATKHHQVSSKPKYMKSFCVGHWNRHYHIYYNSSSWLTH
jgi:hypothetical protein